LKANKKNISVREIFRHKLRNAEIIPDSSVSAKLMRKLARREFVRFNPARFNIYYLGGILVAGISAVIILTSRPEKSDHLPSPTEIRRSDTTVFMNTPVKDNIELSEDKSDQDTSVTVKKSVFVRSEVESHKEPAQNRRLTENNVVVPAGINGSFSKRGILGETSVDMNKLQSGFKTDELLFEVSAKEGCSPLKLLFYIKSATYDSCRWTFGDGGYSYGRNPEWIYDIEGEYKVVLNLYGPDNKKTVSSTLIKVYPKPLVRFEISPEKAIIPEDEIRFYNYSTNAVSFKWTFGDGSSSTLYEPRHKYLNFGSYNVGLVVTSDHGCSDSLIVMNAFSGSEYFIEFPNAFIPNIQGPTGGYYSSKSDEAAQVFHPFSSGVSDYQLKVFSKIGIVIFESSDINIGWDGYYKGQLCNPGVYIWKVRGNFINGEPFTRMGDVTLLKN
jgi:PKD repeat protein